ncbi:MAG: DUF4180 domain-containing protein [Oscillochloris sp.]|nr:DUF4180 domain-containing protein [Oscillochloris sp.]
MDFTLVAEHHPPFLEAQPDAPYIHELSDVRELLEACFGYQAQNVLLYAPNLPPAFFDLSSRFAGEMVQHLQQYRVRLAVVCPAGSVPLSSRFNEFLAETRPDGDFAVVMTRAEAVAWLADKT